MNEKNNEMQNTTDCQGVRDEIRQRHQKTKNMTPKEKLAYFWYYYKIHTIVLLLILAFASHWIYTVATAKDYIFYGVMLNSANLAADPLEASFGEYADLDLEEYECFIETSSVLSLETQSQYDMATYQRLTAMMQTNELDALVLDSEVFYSFGFNGMMLDLRTVFSEEELARYEGKIYYIDQAEVRKAAEIEESEDFTISYEQETAPTPEEIIAKAEAHLHPETMAEPIPLGICLTDSPFAVKTGSYEGLIPIYGISVSCERTDVAKQYLDYLTDDSIPFEQLLQNGSIPSDNQ